jgi:hypothetical protein
MSFTALIVITEDPRASGRPAEAVRIAAGVSAWKKVKVALYLRGEAVAVLGEETEGFVDEENYERYLPLLAEGGVPMYVQKSAAALASLGDSALPFEEISDAQLAALAAARNCVLRF